MWRRPTRGRHAHARLSGAQSEWSHPGAGGPPPEGEVVVWESMACALYLARRHGRGDGSDLAPATPREDAEALRWSFWSVTEVEKDALTVLMHRVAMPPPGSARPTWPRPLKTPARVPLRVLEQHLAQQSAQGLPFLAAGRFTVADLCVASVLGWSARRVR